MDHGIGKVFARPALAIEALLINSSFGKQAKHGFTFIGDEFEGFVEEFGLKHRRKGNGHYVGMVLPPGEPDHYKDNICANQVTLPGHILEALKE